MPVLYLPLGIRSGQYVSGLVIVIFWPPEYIRKRCFGLIGDGIC